MKLSLVNTSDSNKINEIEANIKTKEIEINNQAKLSIDTGYYYYGHWDDKNDRWHSVYFKNQSTAEKNILPRKGDIVRVLEGGKIFIRSNYIKITLTGYKNTPNIGILQGGQRLKVVGKKDDIGLSKVWVLISTPTCG